MRILRTVELISGIATSLLALTYFFFLIPLGQAEFGVLVFLYWLLIYGLPGALTVIGAYSHSVKYRSWGAVLLEVITALSVIYILLSFFGGVIGYLGLSFFLLSIAPAMMSIFTGLVALAVVGFKSSNIGTSS